MKTFKSYASYMWKNNKLFWSFIFCAIAIMFLLSSKDNMGTAITGSLFALGLLIGVNIIDTVQYFKQNK